MCAACICRRQANAVVLSIDEKTGIQAKSRKHPTQPVKAGRPERREFECVRHGTASLIAALDVVTSKVVATDVARNDSVHFIEFLEQIETTIDSELAILSCSTTPARTDRKRPTSGSSSIPASSFMSPRFMRHG